MVDEPRKTGQLQVAVLCSGGLDSAILVASEARHALVHPVYVGAGLSWEAQELAMLARLLDAPPLRGAVAPLTTLEVTARDLYPATHWARRGTPPAYDTPDRDVYLPGRNIMLLAKTAPFCADRGIGVIALGTLAGNPFPDATADFFETMGRALSLGLDHPLAITCPFGTLSKTEVIRHGAALGVPFELTLSCMGPVGHLHCARCSKCRERRNAFAAAGIDDPAAYDDPHAGD